MKNLYLVVEGAAFLTNAAFFSFLISFILSFAASIRT